MLQNYANAFERLEQEKTAEALTEAYGTSEGYLPSAYMNAFNTIEEESDNQSIVDTFAPETQYIPSQYVEPLRKEASILAAGGKFLGSVGSKMSKGIGKGFATKGGKFGLQSAGKRGVNVTAFGKKMNITNRQLGGAAVGAGALGIGGAGYAMGKRK